MMEEEIKKFPEQFHFEPEITHREKLSSWTDVVVAGMGGSALGARLITAVYPEWPIRIHNDYDLPQRLTAKEFIIASSYSGNTEETISAYEEARNKGLSLAAISIGGKLLTLADHDQSPYIKIPDTNIQPRMALGFNIIATLGILGKIEEMETVRQTGSKFKADDLKDEGKNLAETLRDRTPVFYASNRNQALAYIVKIKFNETGKIPAFMNVLPELNHNEMTGFDRLPGSAALSEKFTIVFIEDEEDNEKIRNRFTLTRKILESRGLPCKTIKLQGGNRWEKIFNLSLISDWGAFYTGRMVGADPETVPMVEDFKKQLHH
ncbi:MAG: bifunctional phosphoglucose/phosphomannose isomerase [Anaplasmataceae bacterium]|nr:bifunctional phosphoglucose/phosphomannose isomerase [Anaplasmataceae bacterium]